MLEHPLWDGLNPIILVFMICWVMYGNGARMGMIAKPMQSMDEIILLLSIMGRAGARSATAKQD